MREVHASCAFCGRPVSGEELLTLPCGPVRCREHRRPPGFGRLYGCLLILLVLALGCWWLTPWWVATALTVGVVFGGLLFWASMLAVARDRGW